MALGAVVGHAFVRVAVGVRRAVRSGAIALPSALRSLTREPPLGGAFNDSRDVWPVPADD
ncbi:hypothetical protein O7600_15200 [Micromonospora sp. WMMA1998]|uniref:hypothetical protein n=1 Tax=Micromonospora sp. WMMA1998 TaxID=3015167 RepID=UPI00248BB6A8|nr:hypothetical protein [Micromonospora sp. WMMA1998]WBC12536.1 hypothetical protein O7600_15200 [Micromonospora sp. WMMA1998]